jgi:hypothetical protein
MRVLVIGAGASIEEAKRANIPEVLASYHRKLREEDVGRSGRPVLQLLVT